MMLKLSNTLGDSTKVEHLKMLYELEDDPAEKAKAKDALKNAIKKMHGLGGAGSMHITFCLMYA